MIRLKTATLPAACLQAGAILQNASDDDADLLNLAGIHLGIAFQLQDDLLDLYADPTVFGKATGNDILTAKKTFLLVSALHFAPSPHPDDILRILHDTALPPREKIDAITRIFDLIDIRTHTLQQINFHYDNALRHLQRVSGPPSKKQSLYELIDSLRNRQT
jgi:geranylgeranyl diphosphate synthase type II